MGLGKDEGAKQAVRAAGLLGVVCILCVLVCFVPIFVRWNQPHPGRQVVGVNDEQAVLWVVGIAAPVHPPDISWD